MPPWGTTMDKNDGFVRSGRFSASRIAEAITTNGRLWSFPRKSTEASGVVALRRGIDTESAFSSARELVG